MDTKQPIPVAQARDLFFNLPTTSQAEIMSAPTYLCCVQRARKFVPTLSEAVGIAKMLGVSK